MRDAPASLRLASAGARPAARPGRVSHEGRQGVLDYLNKALRSELTAISQYWLHYRLQDDWGYGKLAEKSRKESIEEMHHADKLMDRIIFLEGHPNLQTLDPLRIGENPRETLDCDLAGEYDARTLYAEARDTARRSATTSPRTSSRS